MGRMNEYSVCNMAIPRIHGRSAIGRAGRRWKIGHGVPHAFLTSSCVSSSVSTATLLPVELNAGPVHFDGQALLKFQRSFSAPVSSSSTIDPFLRSVLPSITALRQFQSSPESVMPRLSVIAVYLFRPDSL